MLYYTGLLFLVISVSIDGFGVGITYGMRNIRVPLVALFIIMVCSGSIVLISMSIGELLSMIISPSIANMLGGAILITLGLFSFTNAIITIRKKNKQEIEEKDTKRFTQFKHVLTTPDKADLDQSGTISPGEALLLGAALALDAFGAGIGAAIIGYSPMLTALLIGIMSGTFLFSGIQLGMFLSKSKLAQNLSFLAPVMLITLGIINIV